MDSPASQRKSGWVEEARAIEVQISALKQRNSRASEVGFAASGLNREGTQLEKSGDVRGALVKYRTALDLVPTGYGFRLNYALALSGSGDGEMGLLSCAKSCASIPTMQTPQKRCI